MHILELLQARGIDLSRRIKFIRHMGDRDIVPRILELGLLEEYQRHQKPYFAEADMIVAFVGTEGSYAKLWGAYEVKGSRPLESPPQELLDAGHAPSDFEGLVQLDLEQVSGLEDLEQRVIIDWGKSPLAWHQWATEKEVVQLLPAGFVKAFPGYLDFVLTFDELTHLITNPTANKEWRTLLSKVAGVYLIVDGTTGQQYVGSAYGSEGVWGRWSEYVKTGHGGNKKLVELLADRPDHAKNFTFTLLRTLPRTLTNAEVISFEGLYKEKLGTRVFGLNSN